MLWNVKRSDRNETLRALHQTRNSPVWLWCGWMWQSTFMTHFLETNRRFTLWNNCDLQNVSLQTHLNSNSLRIVSNLMRNKVTFKTWDFQFFSGESSTTTVWLFYLHYGSLSLHLHLHTHSIHSKTPYLENTQKHRSFFFVVVLCVTSKKKKITLETQHVK